MKKRIRVKHYQRIDEHEFTILGDHVTKVLAIDLVPTEVPQYQSFDMKPPEVVGTTTVLMWNGRRRNIRKIKGQWYLITKYPKTIDK